MKVERAEAGSRLRITGEDRQYSGIARHPLAREWMLNRLIEAREAAACAEDGEAELRGYAVVERIVNDLRRCGMKIGGDV